MRFLSLLKKRNPKNSQNSLLDELEELENDIYKHHQLFNLASSDDQIEALIYEEKALSIKYSALIQKARRNGVKIQYFERV